MVEEKLNLDNPLVRRLLPHFLGIIAVLETPKTEEMVSSNDAFLRVLRLESEELRKKTVDGRVLTVQMAVIDSLRRRLEEQPKT